MEELEKAVKELLDARNNVEWTYEDAYNFLFKSDGYEHFAKLIELTGWTRNDQQTTD